MQIPDATSTAKRIADRLYPLIQGAVSGPEAAVVQSRIAAMLATTLSEMAVEAFDARRATDAQHAKDTAARRQRAVDARATEVTSARRDEQARCRSLREADATSADLAQRQAVTAARNDEQSKCAALRADAAIAADAARASAVAAAKTSERALCVQEIAAAPVTGITLALNVFAKSMRDQIKAYVAGGPH